jgi:hypothetical protein
VLKKKRTIVWLSPGRGGFNVLFILSDRAVAAARAAKLPRAVLAALATAPKYPEGTGSAPRREIGPRAPGFAQTRRDQSGKLSRAPTTLHLP